MAELDECRNSDWQEIRLYFSLLVIKLDQQQPVGRWAATRPAVGPRVELKHEPVKARTHDAI